MPRLLADFECPSATPYRKKFIELGISVKDAAAALNLNECHLGLVLAGKRRLTTKTELQIKKFLSMYKRELLFYTDMTL